MLSHVRLLATSWTAAHQAPLSMGFSRQEYWSGLPCPSPRDLPDPGIEPASSLLAGGFFSTEPPGKPNVNYTNCTHTRVQAYLILSCFADTGLFTFCSFYLFLQIKGLWQPALSKTIGAIFPAALAHFLPFLVIFW